MEAPGGKAPQGRPGARPGATAPAAAAGRPGTAPGAPRSAISYRRLLRWSWVCVRGAFGLFLLGTILSLVVQTLAQYNVQVLSTVLARLGGGGGPGKGGQSFLDALVPGGLMAAGVLFVTLLFVLVVLRLVGRLVNAAGDNVMSARLQRRMHDHLLELGPAYHQAHDVGTTQLVVSQFVVGTQALFKDFIAFPLLRGIGLVTALLLLIGNVQKIGGAPTWMSVLLLSTILLLPFGTWWLAQKMRRAYESVRESQKEVSEELLNSLSQPLEVQVLRAEAQRNRSFGEAIRRLVRNRIRAVVRNELVTQFQQATPDILRAVFLLYAVVFALQNRDPAAVGPIIAIFFFVPEAVRPLQEILQFFVGLNAAWPQVENVVEVLETEPAVRDRPDARVAPSGLQALGLDEVTFSYTPGGRRILDALTHTFPPGRVTGLVARSGGGKSTLFNVLCRLQDPQAGAVRFADADIRDLTVASYRRRVTKVSQFPLLVMDTLRANFKLADADATDEQIRAACERTGLWEELLKVDGRPEDPLDLILPRSWDQGLSGGQRRVLAITRALLTKPSVLLLDEPTTGVDALWRDRIVALVRELSGAMSILVVDHNVREFVAEVADEVCVLEDGHFTQVGPPAALSGTPGLFQSLYEGADEHEAAAAHAGPGVPGTAGASAAKGRKTP